MAWLKKKQQFNDDETIDGEKKGKIEYSYI